MAWGWSERCARARRWIEAAVDADDSRLARHQEFGASRLQFLRLEPAAVEWVAGVDAQVEGEVGVGAAVLFRSCPTEPVAVETAQCTIRLPYRFGFLGYRELGPIFAALARLGQRPWQNTKRLTWMILTWPTG